ncbi:MAG: hypothetical protein KJZ93_30920 [Caldilineaceae bacterium]|nr:hypothetical protein [Caldilineaceae bacterium]
MEYTTKDLVKGELHATETTDDDLLAKAATRASRAIDRHCTGVVAQGSDNYFELASVADEVIQGQIDRKGNLLCWPRKPVVTAVSALSYRETPRENWQTVQTSDITFEGGVVTAWLGLSGRGQMFVKISYTGGLAAIQEALPADFVEAATVLAGRYYREGEGGLTDSIGVADMGTPMIYTKAMPVRVRDMLTPYKRVVRW